jgi:hypothetical protein
MNLKIAVVFHYMPKELSCQSRGDKHITLHAAARQRMGRQQVMRRCSAAGLFNDILSQSKRKEDLGCF